MHRRTITAAAIAIAVVLTSFFGIAPAEAATTTPFTKQCHTAKRRAVVVNGEWRKTSTTRTVQGVVIVDPTPFDYMITRERLTDEDTGKYVNGYTGVVHAHRASKKWSPAKSFPRKHKLVLVIKGYRVGDRNEVLTDCSIRP